MKATKKQLELRRKLGVKYVQVRRSASKTGEPARPTPMVKGPGRDEISCPSTRSARSGQAENAWCLGEGPKAEELRTFQAKIRDCLNCPLGKTRKHFVFGMGNPDAKVLFIGEAPGADEDEQGLPFVGRAGQLLTKIIESTKTWKREEVFIANVLKCRPPGNRPPLPEEVEQCLPYLKEQIRLLKPVLLVALGASAAQALLNTKTAVGKLRNMWHEVEGIPVRVTYHPAALLRFEGYKKDVFEDMKVLTAKYKELSGT